MIIAFFITVYVLIAIALFGILTYREGTMDEGENLIISIFWPIALVVLIISSPFLWARWLAIKLRENKKKKIDPWIL